jgi:hypothetical protein
MQIVCFHQLFFSHILRVHMDIFQIYENTCKLRSHLAIPSNQNQNLFGWAKLRSRMAIPFNQNQTLRVLPDGRVWTFFFCFENFLMVRFFSFFFLMIRFDQTFHLMLFFLWFCRTNIGLSWLQGWHLSFLMTEINWFFSMTRLEDLMLPDCRVDLKTPYDDKVDLLISLRFS